MKDEFDKDAAQKAAWASISKLQKDDCFTDLIVKCGGKEHKVHKNVLCATSDWFKTACTGRFIEAKSKMIELHDDIEEVVSAMITFCYQFDYDEPTTTPTAFHVRVFAIGEKYMVPALQSLAASRLRSSTKNKWNIADFTVVIKEVYENTTDLARQLRSAVIEASVEHKAELFGADADDVFVKSAGEQPGYTLDIIREMSLTQKRKRDNEDGPWRYRCFVGGTGCPGGFTIEHRQENGTKSYHCTTCGAGHGLNWSKPGTQETWKNFLSQN